LAGITGIVKSTAGTPSIAVAGTDYQAPLADVITAQAYANPDSVTVTAKGLVTSITAGAAKALQSTTITAGTGLSGGGSLAANRTLDLADTAVTPGSYTTANITVDQQGRITAAASGSGGVTSVAAGDGLTGGGTGAVTLNVAAADTTITVNGDSIQVGQITNSNVAAAAGLNLSKIEVVDALSVVGNRLNSSAVPDDSIQTTAGSNAVLRENANQINFGLLIDANIDAGAGIQHSKLAFAATGIMCRAATGSGALGVLASSGTPGDTILVQPDGTLAFGAGGGGGYATIENPNGTPVTARAIVAFSSEFTVADNTDTTDISIATNGVAYSKLAQGSAVSVLGVAGTVGANIAEIQAASGDTVMRRNGSGGLDFGKVLSAMTGGFTDTQVILGQSGGNLVDAKDKVIINSPETAKALEYAKQMSTGTSAPRRCRRPRRVPGRSRRAGFSP
jgi:hypothetical protein